MLQHANEDSYASMKTFWRASEKKTRQVKSNVEVSFYQFHTTTMKYFITNFYRLVRSRSYGRFVWGKSKKKPALWRNNSWNFQHDKPPATLLWCRNHPLFQIWPPVTFRYLLNSKRLLKGKLFHGNIWNKSQLSLLFDKTSYDIVSFENQNRTQLMFHSYLFTGCYVSIVSWYHEALGTPIGTLSISHFGVQWVLCRSDVCHACVWRAHRTFWEISSVLLLWSNRNHMVTNNEYGSFRQTKEYFRCRYLSWLWLVFEKPAYHTCIDTKELLFIENSLGELHQKYTAPTLTNTPWKEFFTSMPCYAIFVANFCRSWNFYLLVLFQTSMFQDTFHAELTEVGYIDVI